MLEKMSRGLAALAIVLSIGVTACSSGQPSASPTSAAPAPTAAAPASSPAAASPAPAAPAPSAAVPSPATAPRAAASSAPSASASPAAQAAKHVKPLGVPASGPIAIKMAIPQLTSTSEALYVAIEQGFLAQNGLTVSLSTVQPNPMVAALQSGELQIAMDGAIQVANADVGGSDLVMVATGADLPIFSLYAQSKYQSVTDLAGQRIGITAPGTSTEATARIILQHYGMEGKVQIVPAGGTQPSVLAAVKQGVVAAGILAPPITAQAAQQGLRELVNGTTLGVPLNLVGVVVSRKYLQAHRDVVVRFLTAYQQAWTFCADPANANAVTSAVQKYTKSTPEAARVAYEAMKPVIASEAVPNEGVEAVRNILTVSPNQKLRTADPTQYIDNSILDAIPSAS